MGSVLVRIISLVMFFTLLATVGIGQPLPAKPKTLVNDYAGVLASQNKQALEQKLVRYDDSTSTQIAIVIEKYLENDDAFDRSIKIADAWGIGGSKNDNGVLIYVAVDNRKIFIQNGYGVEDRLTDAMTKRIIEQVIVPSFRGGQYYVGLNKATSIMIDLMQGRYKADPRSTDANISPLVVLIIFLLALFLISWLFSGGSDDDDDGGYHRGGRYRGPTRGRRRGGWVIMPGGGGGFGGGFGGGGGGFGGFGGGGFGGGGAGGSW